MELKPGFYKCRNGLRVEVIRVYNGQKFPAIGIVFAKEKVEAFSWTIDGKVFFGHYEENADEHDIIELWVDKIKFECEEVVVKDETFGDCIIICNPNLEHGKSFKCILEEL